MDFTKMMQMASQLRDQLGLAQSEQATTEVTGEAGGGLVRVTMNGKYEVLKIDIDAKAVDVSDLHLLEDLLRAAFNQATTKIGSSMRDKLDGFSKNLGIDLSMFKFPGSEG